MFLYNKNTLPWSSEIKKNSNCSVPDVSVAFMAVQGPPLRASFIVAAAPAPPWLNSYEKYYE